MRKSDYPFLIFISLFIVIPYLIYDHGFVYVLLNAFFILCIGFCLQFIVIEWIADLFDIENKFLMLLLIIVSTSSLFLLYLFRLDDRIISKLTNL